MHKVEVWPKRSVGEREFLLLSTYLPEVVADALTCNDHDGKLSGNDVEVRFFTQGVFDVSNNDIDLIIYANLYDDRLKNLDRSTKKIAEEISGILPKGTKVSICIRLAPAAFYEFKV